ncbi:MAG: hypothetical protein JW779_10945 [Candidatus Thorarchaeota archaeon]|nr:hypothetical protein [Candidatus Thorarchaeota archaeon]
MKKKDDEFIDRTTSHLVPLLGESVLYDIIVKDGVFTQEKVSKLEKMYASKIANNANLKRNATSIPYKQLLLEAAADLFTEMVLAFNILLAGVISPLEYYNFSFGATAYVDAHLLEIPELVEKKLRLLTVSKLTEVSLANAFIRLIQFALRK